MLNFGLLKNPINWIIVTLMVLFGGLGLSLIAHSADKIGDTK